MKQSESLQKLREALEELEKNTDYATQHHTQNGDPLEQLLFRFNNIGFNIKRIADSLSEIKQMMKHDRRDDL